MRGWIIAAVAAAVMATAGAAQAQVSAKVVSMLEQLAQETVRRETDRPAGEGHTYYQGEVGSLNDDEERVSPLIGDWQGTVTVSGFCDQNCTDLDLYVIDEDGNTVASDASVDASPTVTFGALEGRTYRLRAKMYTCAQNPCYYGVGAYYAVR
ncbi:MAG TPA: hypothetical protein VEA80_02865 [Vitreimonas sp.]|uniref:hypothetical protein n=1 Tax=Vitreimonas sp. TaxID=3069702 RepID=UPI002D299671|nr:hypothetical protein [Vitreimonas sp.]HYD86394.1 hypothetical protein [Vitreimonas sp.]